MSPTRLAYRPAHRSRFTPSRRNYGRTQRQRLLGTAAFGLSALFGLSGFVPGLQATPLAGPQVSAAASRAASQSVGLNPEKAQLKPSFVEIERIGTTSSLISLGLHDDGSLQVPTVPSQAGWYAGGVVPGEVGPAVIVGHLDSYVAKTAIFSRLRELVPGDLVRVVMNDGSINTFSVTRIDEYPKSVFPTSLVYGKTSKPELRLITCAGKFDSSVHSYTNNTVVYAELLTTT
jgi:Sortase domain